MVKSEIIDTVQAAKVLTYEERWDYVIKLTSSAGLVSDNGLIQHLINLWVIKGFSYMVREIQHKRGLRNG
jgi:hypothetical protein